MTRDEIKARPSTRNRAKIEATTEEDIRRQMIEDGEDPDADLREEDIIPPWHIRKRLGMSRTAIRRYAPHPLSCDIEKLGAEPGGDGARDGRADAHLGA